MALRHRFAPSVVYKSLTVVLLGLGVVFADACALRFLNPGLPFLDLLYESASAFGTAGLSASLAGLALVPAAIATFACSVLFLASGNRLGSCHGLQLAGCVAEPVSGILLIGLGLVQLFW